MFSLFDKTDDAYKINITYYYHDYLFQKTGAPNEKKYEKCLECSFPLSDIVLWPLRAIFVRAKII